MNDVRGSTDAYSETPFRSFQHGDGAEPQTPREKDAPNTNAIPEEAKLSKIYSCTDCGLKFVHKKTLKKHELVHSNHHPFWCKICMHGYCNKEEYVAHRLQEHSQKREKYKCRLCSNQIFDSENEYLVHINELHKGRDNDVVICSECGKHFKTKSELTQHNRSKCGTVKQFKCMTCDQDLMTQGSLYNHMRRHSGELPFMCGYCGKQFVTLGQLQVHARIHTQDKAFKCDVCGKGFCHRQSLITHSSIHTGIRPYQCENCSKSFSCVGNLLKHRRTHADSCGLVPLTSHRVVNPNTRIKVKINTPDSSKLKTFNRQKEIQNKILEYKQSLEEQQHTIKREIQSCEMISENKCTERLMYREATNSKSKCDISTAQIKNIKCEMHDIKYGEKDYNTFKPVHEPHLKNLPEDAVSETNLEIKCKYCIKTYRNGQWLKKHEQQHEAKAMNANEKFSYKCSCCKVGFNTKEECRSHQENEHFNILMCEDCDKIFANVDSLRSHQNIFHKGLPRKIYTYICEKCGFQFRQKVVLEQHKQSECGDIRTYQCNTCSKTFNSIYSLKTHVSVHDPKKKFLCKFCGKSFRWKGQLKIHERSHTGEKPFKCLYCPKAFPYRESLITHSSLHTGIKPHLCQACGSRFSCIGNLIKHRLTHATSCGMWYTKNHGSY